MNVSRRTILKSAAIGAATAIGSAVTRAPALAESDTVKVASLHDLSGAVDVYGIPSHMCMKVAIDEINAAGGLLGKKIELKVYDGQSNIKNYPRYAQQAALEDEVVMLQGVDYRRLARSDATGLASLQCSVCLWDDLRRWALRTERDFGQYR